MKVVAQESWEFTLYDDTGRLFLEVVCGGVALFEVAIELNALEREVWETQGVGGLMDLVERVRSSPGSFVNRKVVLPM